MKLRKRGQISNLSPFAKLQGAIPAIGEGGVLGGGVAEFECRRAGTSESDVHPCHGPGAFHVVGTV